MVELNTNIIVENIASFAKPYKSEINRVRSHSSADLPFVLRRLLWQIPRRIPPGCSKRVLRRYRVLEGRVERDLASLNVPRPKPVSGE